MNPPRTATIIKTFRFEAAHQLVGSGTECDHVHGHSYRFEVHLTGPVREHGQQRGMVINFADVSRIVKREIIERLDHKFISARGQEPTVGYLYLAAKHDSDDSSRRIVENGIEEIDIPTTTAEEMARWIGKTLVAAFLPVSMIRFWETETGCAEYHVTPAPKDSGQYDAIITHEDALGSPAFRETC